MGELHKNRTDLGVWAVTGGFRTIQKVGGRRPPTFWMVLKLPGTAQTPNDRFVCSYPLP